MIFSRNLKRLRYFKKATVHEVSTAVGVSLETYAAWESGEKEPWLDDLCRLAKFFKLPIDYIVDEDFDYEEYLRQLKARGMLD